jgi:anti-sigma factor RsiW
MTQHRTPDRTLFSPRLDGELDGNTARAFDRELAEHPELAEEYATFAEVVHLINALPRPPADPDFALKVQRRIRHRQRARRRARPSGVVAPALSSLGTAIALLVVVGVGLMTQPLDLPLSEPVAADTGLGAGAPVQLSAGLDVAPAALAQVLAEASARGLIHSWRPGATAASFEIVVDATQLAVALDLLGSGRAMVLGQDAARARSTLHITVRPAG